MGVTHKLSQEVIDFIIARKKESPRIGVRKLADLVGETFQTKISKSSVNNVLKEANLSSSVGRRAQGTFKIPREKKEQLFVPQKKPEPPKKVDKSEQIKKELEKLNRPMSLMKDPVKSSMGGSIQAGQAPAVKTDEKANDVERQKLSWMGLIFLKAAQWEIFEKPPLGQLLTPYIGKDQPDKISEACLYFRLLNIVSDEDVRDSADNAIWYFSGLPTDTTVSHVSEWTQKGEEVSQKLLFEALRLQNEMKMGVQTFCAVLRDKTVVSFDASLTRLRTNTDKGSELPIDRAMGALSKRLVVNRQPLIFFFQDETMFESPDLQRAVRCFDYGVDNHISQVKALDGQGRELAEFSVIPNKRRLFVAGLPSPAGKTLKEIRNAIKWAKKQKLSFPALKRAYYFSELKASEATTLFAGRDTAYRLFALWPEKGKRPGDFAEAPPAALVITNILRAQDTEIVSEFILRWPELAPADHRGIVSDLNESQPISQKKVRDFNGLLDGFGQELQEYCLTHYGLKAFGADIQDLAEHVYRLSGTAAEDDRFLVVELEIGQGYPYIDQIQNSVKMFNERMIINSDDKRVLVRVKMA
ncbi:MAG: helix-turn-helix domain-containing protein [Candidatus Omnitrophica bacterium]|nr:helix-turn-helix domain-containing protein [Candidatus Omnitrophota bacterium]